MIPKTGGRLSRIRRLLHLPFARPPLIRFARKRTLAVVMSTEPFTPYRDGSPCLAEVALGLAHVRDDPLRTPPHYIARAAAEIVRGQPDASAHDVLEWAHERLAGTQAR